MKRILKIGFLELIICWAPYSCSLNELRCKTPCKYPMGRSGGTMNFPGVPPVILKLPNSARLLVVDMVSPKLKPPPLITFP